MTPLLADSVPVIRWSPPAMWEPSTGKRLRDRRAVLAALDAFAEIAEPSLLQTAAFDEMAARVRRAAEWAAPDPVRAVSPIEPQCGDEPLPDDGRVVPFRRQAAGWHR